MHVIEGRTLGEERIPDPRAAAIAGAGIGAITAVLIIIVFVVPKAIFARDVPGVSLLQLSGLYLSGFVIAGTLVGALVRLFLRHWLLAGLVGTVAAIPVIVIFADATLENRSLLPTTVLLLSPAFGFPLGAFMRFLVVRDLNDNAL